MNSSRWRIAALVGGGVVLLVLGLVLGMSMQRRDEPALPKGEPEEAARPARAAPKDDSLRISIVPGSRYDGADASIYLDKRIFLVLHNRADTPVRVWKEWCSWGYYAIDVTLTSPEGNAYRIGRGPQAWTINAPDYFLIPGNGYCVRPIDLSDGSWTDVPWDRIKNHALWKMKVRFSTGEDKFAKDKGVWTGAIQDELVFKAYIQRD